jgi:hypothetical protein
MRAARWFLGLSASFSVVAAVAAGCGGGTNGAAPIDSGTEDATSDVRTAEAAVEAAPDVVEASAPEAAACIPDASLQSIPVPDASFGDSGATAASCLSCFESSCPMVVTQCNASCSCVSAYEGLGACLQAGTSALTCIGTFAASSGLGLNAASLTCAGPCVLAPAVCGFTIPNMGGDSGTPTGDGATGDGATTTDGATHD